MTRTPVRDIDIFGRDLVVGDVMLEEGEWLTVVMIARTIHDIAPLMDAIKTMDPEARAFLAGESDDDTDDLPQPVALCRGEFGQPVTPNVPADNIVSVQATSADPREVKSENYLHTDLKVGDVVMLDEWMTITCIAREDKDVPDIISGLFSIDEQAEIPDFEEGFSFGATFVLATADHARGFYGLSGGSIYKVRVFD